jgi:hypothetical protein
MEQNITISMEDPNKKRAQLSYADGSRYTTDKYVGCDHG